MVVFIGKMCTQTQCSVEITRRKGSNGIGGFKTTKHTYPSYDRTVITHPATV